MLPLFPKQQTSLSAVGTSAKCQKRTSGNAAVPLGTGNVSRSLFRGDVDRSVPATETFHGI